jgi:hypothetical protein
MWGGHGAVRYLHTMVRVENVTFIGVLSATNVFSERQVQLQPCSHNWTEKISDRARLNHDPA